MAKWHLAKSLETLRKQLNAAYPDRSKVSDGSIGDASHSARTSDHNPNGAGVVCAIDVTHDPEHLPGELLATTLVASRDARIKYIIWDKRMCRAYPANGKPAWVWQPYSGLNAHQHHVHISVKAEAEFYDSTNAWALPPDEPEVVETVTTVTDAPPAPVTVVQTTSMLPTEKIKEIAGTGLSTVGMKLATGGISGGVLATITAFIEKAWPILIFAGVLLILGVGVWLMVYHKKHEEKQLAAKINSDPGLHDLVFK
jgi:hypothetical protein